uniref:Uncharacterized protein n=1 Tax=Arabidopsis cebennensis TaxID=97979 RepID=B2BXZ2_9BRAS|nr:unknown [Arabidopsis cebennensis]
MKMKRQKNSNHQRILTVIDETLGRINLLGIQGRVSPISRDRAKHRNTSYRLGVHAKSPRGTPHIASGYMPNLLGGTPHIASRYSSHRLGYRQLRLSIPNRSHQSPEVKSSVTPRRSLQSPEAKSSFIPRRSLQSPEEKSSVTPRKSPQSPEENIFSHPRRKSSEESEANTWIKSNQEIFQKPPKNKEHILIRDILGRLRGKWKSSENIAGEAVYYLYIKRLKDFARRVHE